MKRNSVKARWTTRDMFTGEVELHDGKGIAFPVWGEDFRDLPGKKRVKKKGREEHTEKTPGTR